MADHRQQHQGNVTVPAVPGSGFIMRQAKFVLGSLEAVFDGLAVSLDSNDRLDQRSGRAPGGEVSHLAIGDMAADQQAALHIAREAGQIIRETAPYHGLFSEDVW